MKITSNKTKLSISLDPVVASKLPKLNRSMFIETILKQHYQLGGIDNLYQSIKQKLLRDPDFEDLASKVPCPHGASRVHCVQCKGLVSIS